MENKKINHDANQISSPEEALLMVQELRKSLNDNLYPALGTQLNMMAETLAEISEHEKLINQLINDAMQALALERGTETAKGSEH